MTYVMESNLAANSADFFGILEGHDPIIRSVVEKEVLVVQHNLITNFN